MNNLCPEKLSSPYSLFVMAICLFTAVFFYGCGEDKKDNQNSEPSDGAQHEQTPDTNNQEGESGGESGAKKTQVEVDEIIYSESGVFRFDEINTQRQDTSIPIADGSDVSSKAKEILKQGGSLGDEDDLTPIGEPKPLGTSQIVKLQQTYQGIPIHGAETVVTINNKHIEKIYSKTLPNIEIDIRPALSIDQVADHAEKVLEEELIPQDEATLIIVKIDDKFKLAWMGLFAIAGDIRTIIFDAHNGNILSQRTALTNTKDHENLGKDDSNVTE